MTRATHHHAGCPARYSTDDDCRCSWRVAPELPIERRRILPNKFIELLDHLAADEDDQHDPVNHPQHYTSHPSGVECIDVVEHMGFNLGNAIKYIWRADLKADALEDLRKAAWYVNREIDRRSRP